MLVKTEAIVLKSMKYRDTSKIVTFYSKEFGKIKGIAKGARTAKNIFGSALEPMTHVELVIYKKEHQDIHLISQCDVIVSYKNLLEDLNRMAAALAIIELCSKLTHHEEKNPGLYSLLTDALSSLNEASKNFIVYLYAFEIRTAMLFGYSPNLDVCGNCGSLDVTDGKSKKIGFQIVSGAVFCNKCQSAGRDNVTVTDISEPVLQILRRLMTAQFSSLGNLEIGTDSGNEIDMLLRLYLRYHFDGLKPLKSMEFLNL